MRPRHALRLATAVYRAEWRVALRNAAYMSLVGACVVSFGLLMPSLEYRHVATLEAGRWDLWVSGPITAETVESVASREDVEGLARIMRISVDSATGPRTSTSDRSSPFSAFAYREPSDLADGPLPDGLLVSGRRPEPGEWACDWYAARLLGARVGDELTAAVAFPSGPVEMVGVLAGIYGPSGDAERCLALPLTPELELANEKVVGDVVCSDLFVRCDDPAALAADLSADPRTAEQLFAIARPDLASESRSRLHREVGPFLRSSASWVALAAFVALSLWQRGARHERRIRTYATFVALGMARRDLLALDVAEQSLVLGLVSMASMGLGTALLQDVGGGFAPPGALRGLGLLLAGAVALSVATGAAMLRRRLATLSVPDLLAGG